MNSNELLTEKDIRKLNKARDVLDALEDRARQAGIELARDGQRSILGPSPVSMGRVAQAADHAGDAIFDALNIARAYGSLKVSDDLILNRKSEDAVL